MHEREHRKPWFSNFESTDEYEYDEAVDVLDNRVGLHKQAESFFIESTIIGGDMYDIYVYDTEGKIPHFHLVVNNEISVAIKIQKPSYYTRDNGSNRLRDVDIDNLINILSRPQSNSEGKSVWSIIILVWNADCRNKRISWNTRIPKYEKLKLIPE